MKAPPTSIYKYISSLKSYVQNLNCNWPLITFFYYCNEKGILYSLLPAWEGSWKKLELFAFSLLERANFCDIDLEQIYLITFHYCSMFIGVGDANQREHLVMALAVGKVQILKPMFEIHNLLLLATFVNLRDP